MNVNCWHDNNNTDVYCFDSPFGIPVQDMISGRRCYICGNPRLKEFVDELGEFIQCHECGAGYDKVKEAFFLIGKE